MKFEEIIPELRKGRRFRIIDNKKVNEVPPRGWELPHRAQIDLATLLNNEWELEPLKKTFIITDFLDHERGRVQVEIEKVQVKKCHICGNLEDENNPTFCSDAFCRARTISVEEFQPKINPINVFAAQISIPESFVTGKMLIEAGYKFKELPPKENP